jgi:hypothetical protein
MMQITRCRRQCLLAVLALLAVALLTPAPTLAQGSAIVVDDGGAGFSSSSAWTVSGGVAGAYGSSYRHDGGSGAEPGSWARWQPSVTTAGYYQISMRWAAHPNRPDAAPVTVVYDGGVDLAIRVNQQQNTNSWVVLGTYPMAAGAAGYVQIGADDAGYTVADAIQLTPAPAPAPSFPSFSFQGVALSPASLSYNPTGEIIFPSVIRAADHFSNPLGDYYLYYAPHDAPGGINLAYADSPAGPWTEYANNPIIGNAWSPHYSVGHVSSPHALWNADEGKLFLYFHGDNDKTRLASSTDGIAFSYEGVMVSTATFPNVSETSYARVFEHTMPSKQNRYIMLLMGNNAGTRRIYLAWSNDGRSWTAQAAPLISPNAQEGANISAPWFFPWGGDYFVVYHASSGNMHSARVGANLDQEQHLGVFYDDPAERAAAPTLIDHGGYTYMLYERGPRLSAEIAYARAGGPPQQFEAESLAASTTGDAHSVFTDAQMSAGAGTKLNADAAGDRVTYTLTAPAGGSYSLRVGIKRQNTRGIYQLSVLGAPLGQPLDFYAPSDTYQERTIGTVRFAGPGSVTVSFTATGRNASSQGWTLGLDYITLVPLP